VTAHPWPLRSYLELGALPTAVPCARLHARHLVWESGLNGLADSTELLVSELVTNALKTTAGQEDQTALRLRLSSDNARVLIEVWDADPQPPAPKDLSEDGMPELLGVDAGWAVAHCCRQSATCSPAASASLVSRAGGDTVT